MVKLPGMQEMEAGKLIRVACYFHAAKLAAIGLWLAKIFLV